MLANYTDSTVGHFK